MLLRDRFFRIVHDAEGAGGGGGGSEAPAQPAAAAAPPAAEPGAGAEATRPDYLPEKFWKADEKAPDIEGMAKSYAELEAWKGQRLDKLKADVMAELRAGVPEKPDGYAIKVPDDLLPEGFKADIPADDPFIGEMRAVFHELGAKPEQFEKAATAFLRWQVSNMPDVAAERAKLGEGAPQRLAAVDAWLAKALPEKQYMALSHGLLTAPGIEALETLMRLGRGSVAPDPGNGAGTSASEALTPAQAMALQADPDYRHPIKGEPLRARFREFIKAGGKLPGYQGQTERTGV
jgi:hypothetical protein